MSDFQLLQDKFRGSLLGLATGDALGTAVEFQMPGSFPEVVDITGGGVFNLPKGYWTDDTSLALCLAQSLIDEGRFDAKDQLRKYVRWYREGYMSSTGTCFDIGNTTRDSLERFEDYGGMYPGDHFQGSAGNGSLMRLAPVPLFFRRQEKVAIEFSGFSSRTTHGDLRAVDACRYYGKLIVKALNKTIHSKDDTVEFLSSVDIADLYPLNPEIEEVAGGSFFFREPPDIIGSGYVVRSLEAALWALSNSDSFEDGALLAVNLGDDADTTGAIYGQLAGALYGESGIPENWLESLYIRKEITLLADQLLLLSEKATDSS